MEGYPANVLQNTSNVSIDNPFPIGVILNNSNISVTNPFNVGVSLNNSNISLSNPFIVGVSLNNSNVSLSNPFPVSVISIPPVMMDSFGRIRVSNPFTLFDHYHRYSDDERMVGYTSNTAFSNFDVNGANMALTVGSNAGDRIYRESTRVFSYQPGKSLQIFKSFCMGPPKIGLRQRTGYFDASNGFYLQQDGSNVSFVLRSYSTGVMKETIALQDSWNYDPLKGNGISHYTLNLTRSQILFIDIEWLGVGSARMGFMINGQPQIAHIFHHANMPSTATIDSTLPYMSTACLPVRAEIENTADTGSLSTYRAMCSTVISEGGYELRGRYSSISTGNSGSPISLPLANTLYSVLSIRLKSTRLGAIVVPTDMSIVPISGGNYYWAIIRNGNISNPTWTSVSPSSSVEYTIDGGTITGGSVMRSGYIPATNQATVGISLQGTIFRFQLERDSFTSTPFNFTLAVSSDGPSDSVLASIDWEEITI
jgi:hypothetical protein